MKNKLAIMSLVFGALFGALPFAMAATLYTNDWGTVKQGAPPANNNDILQAQYGWTVVATFQNGPGEYVGTFAATGANDPANGLGLPANTAFFTGLGGTNQAAQGGMMFTTDGAGAGTVGDSEFIAINNPASYSNLTLNVEVRDASGFLTNYFAVQVGGQWYAATSYVFPDSAPLGYPAFTNAFLLLTNTANIWSPVTIDPGGTFITIGSPGSPPDFTQPMTGIGIVQLGNTNAANASGGFNYNEIVINQGVFSTTPAALRTGAVTPQAVYAGGGATFSPVFGGTPTLVYRWQTNGINIGIGANVASGAGTHYLGAQTTRLTITNVSASDATFGVTNFSVVVTNFEGSATNSGLTLNVIPLPASLLYAEWFPPIVSTGAATFPGVGWATATIAGSTFGFFANVGNGGANEAVYNYSPNIGTNAFYTTITNDIGLSGLPFPVLNSASYPAVTLQCAFAPGNGAGSVAGAVSVYWAIQMRDPVGGTNWYSSASRIPIILTGGYQTNQLTFTNAAAGWNNLTIAGNVVTIGSQASSDLAGNITGAGMVIVFNTATGASMDWENFAIVTNAATVLPPLIGNNYPIDLSLPSGGGASFGVAATTGTQPFSYYWTTNNVLAQNGGRVSGATTATLTIADVTAADSGMQIVAFVTNSAGFDESDSDDAYGQATTLTVTNPPVGLIYSEQVPFVGPVTGNYPIGSIGWSEAVSGAPFTVFRSGTAQTTSQGDGAVYAYLGSAGTTVYYATTTSDTNQSGLPFPNIKVSAYTNLNFSVDIAPNSASSTNVTAYLAVQFNGASWYVSTTALLGPNAASNSVYSTYAQTFNPAAANWNTLAISSTGGTIGSTPANNLTGVMTGAGLVFVTVGTGGTFNFDNFLITGTGPGGNNVGGINAAAGTGGNVNLSWVGNPVVKLQSSTNLSSSLYWHDVTNTYGLYSLPVPIVGPAQFFRLTSP